MFLFRKLCIELHPLYVLVSVLRSDLATSLRGYHMVLVIKLGLFKQLSYFLFHLSDTVHFILNTIQKEIMSEVTWESYSSIH